MFHHTSLVLFALYFLLAFSDGQKAVPFFREDYTYVEETQSFYKFHSALPWSEAKRTCELEGAVLLHPEDNAEAQVAQTIWKKASSSYWMYLGITDAISEGTFVTVDGKNIASVFNKWISGEPNDLHGGEDCAVLSSGGDGMNDVACRNHFNFMCKKKLDKKDSCNIRYLDAEKSKHREDYSYRATTQGFYKFHTNPLTWLGAKRMCELEGATLFHPKDDAEAKEALAFWKDTKPAIKWIYSGLSDLISEGTFLTVNGENIADVYSNWKTGQPDDFREREDCVLLTNDGLMNDVVCSDKNRFICKKDIETVEWNHSCDMYNLDYKLNRNNGKCYKLHTKPMDWNGANAVCSAELTSLAVINDQQDADYLAKLAESALARNIGGNYVRGIFHLGFSNKHGDGWTTVKGTPLNKDASLWWGGSVPDDNDSQQCGAMFYTGRLTPVDCSHRSLFVCEHLVPK